MTDPMQLELVDSVKIALPYRNAESIESFCEKLLFLRIETPADILTCSHVDIKEMLRRDPHFNIRERAEVFELKARITKMYFDSASPSVSPACSEVSGRRFRNRSRSRDRRGYVGIFQDNLGEDWYVVSPIGLFPCLRWYLFAVPLEEVRELRPMDEFRKAQDRAVKMLKRRCAEMEKKFMSVPQRAAVGTFLHDRLYYVSCNGAAVTARGSSREFFPSGRHDRVMWEWFRSEVADNEKFLFSFVSYHDRRLPILDVLNTPQTLSEVVV